MLAFKSFLKFLYSLTILSLPLLANAAQIKWNGGKCLDVFGAYTNIGAGVDIWDCHGGDSEKWELVDGQIMGLGGQCFEVYSGNANNGNTVQVFQCIGNPAQSWTYIP